MLHQYIVSALDIDLQEPDITMYPIEDIEKGAKVIAESNGFCINPPVLTKNKDGLYVVHGHFYVACAKEAAKRYRVEQINCYIPKNKKEFDILMNQLYTFRP